MDWFEGTCHAGRTSGIENFIDIKELYKSYGPPEKRIEVLKGLNLQIEKGGTLAIVGASGAGKSTLLHLLGTLDRPCSGQILYSGVNPFVLDEGRLAVFRNRTIGFVFQFHHLLPEFSACENVMMPALISGISEKEARYTAEQILGEVGLKDRLLHKPGELSGGEQQRVAVARALSLNPSILLADEPTGNLDARTGESVHNLLIELNERRGITMIIVTHNERLAERMKGIVLLEDGRAVDRKIQSH